MLTCLLVLRLLVSMAPERERARASDTEGGGGGGGGGGRKGGCPRPSASTVNK